MSIQDAALERLRGASLVLLGNDFDLLSQPIAGCTNQPPKLLDFQDNRPALDEARYSRLLEEAIGAEI